MAPWMHRRGRGFLDPVDAKAYSLADPDVQDSQVTPLTNGGAAFGGVAAPLLGRLFTSTHFAPTRGLAQARSVSLFPIER